MKKKVMLKQKLFKGIYYFNCIIYSRDFFRHKHEGYKFSGEKHSSKIGQHFKPWLDIIETKYSGDWNVKGGSCIKERI